MRGPWLLLTLALAGCGASPPRDASGVTGATERRPPPVYTFADPERRAKLARADADIDALVRAEVAAHGIAGMAVGVVIDGELAHFGGAGFADLEARRAPTADTVFRIASITKSFTALAILALRDDGKLQLDDPLARFVPEIEAMTPASRDAPPVTLRRVLTHTAGLPSAGLFDLHGSGNVGADEIARSLVGDAAEGVPGMGFAYSNLGYQVLGVVVERVAHEPLRRFLAHRLFEPLGMTSTSFDAAGVAPGQLAVGYDRDDAGVERRVPNASYGAAEAAGGILTSVRDMARYLALHMGAYPPRDDADAGPIRRGSLREAHLDALRVGPMSVHLGDAAKGAPPVELREDRYAFGLAVHETCEVSDLVTHNGGLPGWSAAIGFLPRHGVGVVVLTNQGRGGHDPTDLIYRILGALRRTGGLAARVARPRPSEAVVTAMERLLDVYATWSPARYHAMLSPRRGAVPEDEERLELAGYHALHGACSRPVPIGANSGREGRFELRCERGVLEMEIGVDADGLVTSFAGTSRGIPPAPGVRVAVERITSLVGRPNEALYVSTFGDASREAYRVTLARLSRDHGSCRASSYAKEGDRYTVDLACDRGGRLRMGIGFDEARERITSFGLEEPGSPTACAGR